MASPTEATADSRVVRGAYIPPTQREEASELSKISAIDSVMRETGLKVELASRHLEAINDLLERPREERTMAVFTQLVNAMLTQLNEDNVEGFKASLESRPTYIQGGQRIELNDENRQQLTAEFASSLQKTIETFKKQILGQSLGNLEARQQQCEKERDKHLAVYNHMMDSKERMAIARMEAAEGAAPVAAPAAPAPLRDRWKAVQDGNLEALKQEFESLSTAPWWSWWNKQQFLNGYNEDGLTMLHLAAWTSKPNVVRWLLEQGADVKVKNQKEIFDKERYPGRLATKYQPLHLAAKVGDLASVQALLEHQAPVNGKGAQERTPLHMAAFNGHPAVAQALIDAGALINAQTSKDDGCKTPLLEATIQNQQLVVVTLLGVESLDPQLGDSEKRTAFYHAAWDGLVEIAAMIAGHKNFRFPTDQKDPNFKVRQLIPRDNIDKMKAFINNLAAAHPYKV